MAGALSMSKKLQSAVGRVFCAQAGQTNARAQRVAEYTS